MVSNYDDNSLRSAIGEGKRHYQGQKKTSLYGSESPKDDKNRNFKQRFVNVNNIFGTGEQEVLSQSQADSKRSNADMEKRATLEELQRYNPWGKPGAGAPNNVNSNNNNRAKWEYEQEVKSREEVANNAGETFPGFSATFGAGKTSSQGRRRSEVSQNNETKQDSYFPFGSNGTGEPISESNNQRATVTALKNPNQEDLMYKKYEETKAMADDLEKEIQRLKLKQLGDKYDAMKNEKDFRYQDEQDNANKLSSNYDEDGLYREAENRARLRELERLKEAYDRDYPENDSNYSNNMDNRDDLQTNGNNSVDDNQSSNDQRRPRGVKKDSVTINRNDYRPYTVEEYMNCRPQMINPSLNKRTTLSGSEERRVNYERHNDNNYNNNNNTNMQMIDEDNIIRKFSKTNTHSNLFPNERNYSPVKGSTPYQTKAPYATD